MPTPVPEPIKPPGSPQARESRIKALYTMNLFLECVDGWAYSTRSHMPNGVDSTEFYEAVSRVRSFLNARPDWTDEMLQRTFDKVVYRNVEQMKEELKDRYGVEIE